MQNTQVDENNNMLASTQYPLENFEVPMTSRQAMGLDLIDNEVESNISISNVD